MKSLNDRSDVKIIVNLRAFYSLKFSTSISKRSISKDDYKIYLSPSIISLYTLVNKENILVITIWKERKPSMISFMSISIKSKEI
jgi:hypothetical protein